ncbi:MAG: transposase [Bacteroidia bacterium]
MKSRLLNRLSGYDYSRDARYFFTSCVKGRVCCFGNVSNGRMHTNAYGQIAHDQWIWLGQQYPYVRLHAFVVMPNHVHGILEIDRDLIANRDADHRDDSHRDVGTGRDLSLHSPYTGRDLSLRSPYTDRDLSLRSPYTDRDLSLRSPYTDRDLSLRSPINFHPHDPPPPLLAPTYA